MLNFNAIADRYIQFIKRAAQVADDDRDETMNKLLKSAPLAVVLMASMAGGQSAATSPTHAPVAPQGIEALLAVYDDVQIARPNAVAVQPVRTVKSGGYTLITGTDVRAAVEAAKR
ncbi:MAG: hypothetical protein AAGH82_04475 [Pseudomonadota bacterium]